MQNDRNKVTEIYLLIHGVESSGAGMEKLTAALIADDRFPFETCRIKVFKYGRFPFVLSIFELFKSGYSNALYYYIQCERAKYSNLKKINIIAHSWGTYLLSRIILKYDDLKLNKIMLLGSVISEKFEWKFFEKKFEKVVNYVGKRDLVSWIAGLWIAGMGRSGIKGFKNLIDKVNNTWTDWRHCDYAKDENINYIVDECLK